MHASSFAFFFLLTFGIFGSFDFLRSSKNGSVSSTFLQWGPRGRFLRGLPYSSPIPLVLHFFRSETQSLTFIPLTEAFFLVLPFLNGSTDLGL